MRKPYLLALALALLALFFGWRTQQAMEAAPSAGENLARPTATGWQPGAPTTDPPPPPDTASAVAAVKNRPLFRQDRRPYTEAAGAVSARNFDAELARLSLIGIMAIGDDMKGIVVSKGSPNTERWEVKAGDQLPGFKVKEIRPEGLTVTADGREFLLPLYAGPPTSAGGGPVRTEAVRKDPAPAPPKPAAAPAAIPAQPRPPVAPFQRPAAPPPTATPPAVQPAPPSRLERSMQQRYTPGRR